MEVPALMITGSVNYPYLKTFDTASSTALAKRKEKEKRKKGIEDSKEMIVYIGMKNMIRPLKSTTHMRSRYRVKMASRADTQPPMQASPRYVRAIMKSMLTSSTLGPTQTLFS